MAMAFGDDIGTIGPLRPATLGEHARVRTETHRATFFGNGELIDHKVDNRGAGVWIELGAVGIGIAQYMARKGDGGVMDPDVTLDEIRELCRTCNGGDMSELVDKINDLDEWLIKGGFLPQEWRKCSAQSQTV